MPKRRDQTGQRLADATLSVRLLPEELAAIRAAADQRHEPVSAFVRRAALSAAGVHGAAPKLSLGSTSAIGSGYAALVGLENGTNTPIVTVIDNPSG